MRNNTRIYGLLELSDEKLRKIFTILFSQSWNNWQVHCSGEGSPNTLQWKKDSKQSYYSDPQQTALCYAAIQELKQQFHSNQAALKIEILVKLRKH